MKVILLSSIALIMSTLLKPMSSSRIFQEYGMWQSIMKIIEIFFNSLGVIHNITQLMSCVQMPSLHSRFEGVGFWHLESLFSNLLLGPWRDPWTQPINWVIVQHPQVDHSKAFVCTTCGWVFFVLGLFTFKG